MTEGRPLASLAADVREVRRIVLDAQAASRREIDLAGTEHRESARNLVAYCALRRHDLRELQPELARHGLSSLGRSEGQVVQSLEAVLTALDALTGVAPDPHRPLGDYTYGARALRRRAGRLFGPTRPGRASRIMVTLPPEAAGDARLVEDMVARGMGVARINTAHDDPDAWSAMVDHVRAAARTTGLDCRIAVDLAGPKLRTGPVVPGPRVVKLRPTRDRTGHVLAPAPAVLVPTTVAGAAGTPDAPARIPVGTEWLAGLVPGTEVLLHDARGAARSLIVDRRRADGSVSVTTAKTVYLTPGIALADERTGATTAVGELPATEQYLVLRRGDLLRLTADLTPADPDTDLPARIGVTLPELLPCLRVGDAVHLDDGRVCTEVVAVSPHAATLRVTRAAARGSRLRAGRGINAPDTALPVPALTDVDRTHLAFVAEHADVVELSFVRSAADVEALLDALDALGNDRPGHDGLGVVVKIETVQAFEDLPAILLTAMRRHAAGVMIARGDLAVECGYERLAELQEEILWLCEAAHLPVVWATEVLDRMAKSGRPTPAEITDAAMAGRAECVMLNKGPHILEAIDTLDDVLRRMSGHAHKKTSLLRPLHSWSA